MRCQDWIGRTIISQYGLVCEVLEASDKESQTCVKCRASHNGRIWDWTTDEISLVTRDGELLDLNGEIFGKMVDEHWELYPDDQCRQISQGEVEMEFQKKS